MITSQQLKALVASLAALGARRLAMLAVIGLTAMAAVGVAAYFLGRPSMQAIYTGLSSQDVSRITAALAEVGVPFDVNEQRNAVLVPIGQTSRARTLLAQKGLPSSSRAGYELFDQLGSMGLTSFMQEVTRVRALEGEIARTIQALDGVAAARVHLVLPDNGSFRRERREPSASVLLRADARWQHATGQVVRHIVAAAVPGMKVEQVSVASTDGRLLVSGGDDSSVANQKLADMERSLATELEQRASRTLNTALGTGNFQISITASLDVDRQQINETSFDPKSRIERSVRVVKQSGSSEDAGSRPTVGADANVPREETNQAEGDRRRQRDDRREELVNYELNSRTVQTVREGYRVKSLAIAVVVNRAQLASQIGANADAAAIESRLAELKRLVSAATGVRSEREDRIEITAVDFSGGANGLAMTPPPGVVDYLLMNMGVIVNALAMLGVALAAVIGLRSVVRSLVTSAPKMPEAPRNESEQADPEFLSAGASIAPSLSIGALEQSQMIAPAGGSSDSSEQRERLVRERLDALVAANDVKVTKVLKSWMAEAQRA